MLPKLFRIKAPEFFHSKKYSRKKTTMHLTVISKESHRNTPRFVILIPKSVDKRASFRNKIRRFLEEEIRTEYLQAQNHKDICIRVHKFSKDTSFTQMKSELKNLMENTFTSIQKA
ncbi:ribonuclease P protein component [Candidatus Gottesmanbacteria bacterium]|nr:ribonuclease P protein component [Candidatus Gottesmanbacteria bacterium]